MVWAAVAMGVYNLGLQEANASLATATVGVACRNLLGNIGGVIALLGVIILPITSGDTALRALRLSIAEALHIDQTSKAKRLGLSAILFVIVAGILVWAKTNANGFAVLWRYFAWSNQVLSLFAFAAIAIWMFVNGKQKYIWMPLLPGTFYCFVTTSYILNAKIGFNLSWNLAYIIAAILAATYMTAIIIAGKKYSDDRDASGNQMCNH